MSRDFPEQLSAALRSWWREQSHEKSSLGATSLLLREFWGFLCDSTPERRRQRYGDMDYDWEQRVNTTSATVSWQARLLGIFHSPYQPTDPTLFREMMAELTRDSREFNFREFTFIDIGSGKGRTLLLASEYPFRKIVGVELIPELHRAAEENVAAYRSKSSPASSDAGVERTTPSDAPAITTLCLDARHFVFPDSPLLVYLFNPLPEARLREVIRNIETSWQSSPRDIWILYHNAVSERVLAESPLIVKVAEKPEYSVFRTKPTTVPRPAPPGP